jgi:hypothetical protein
MGGKHQAEEFELDLSDVTDELGDIENAIDGLAAPVERLTRELKETLVEISSNLDRIATALESRK